MVSNIYKQHDIKKTKLQYYIAHKATSMELHQERQRWIRRLIGRLRAKAPVLYFDETTTNSWDRPRNLW